MRDRPSCPRCDQFHRRAQLAEAALEAVEPERLERASRSGGNLARTLLNWSATKSREERDKAVAMAGDLEVVVRQAVRLRRTNPKDYGDRHAEQAWEVMGDLDAAVDHFLELHPDWK